MLLNEHPFPIWDEPPHVREIHVEGQICGTNRTGGEFLLMRSGVDRIQKLTERQKVNLNYWIYEYNRQHRMFDKSSWQSENLLVLDQAWVEGHRDLIPSAEDRMLTFLREMIRSDDAGERPRKELLLAAGGCRHDGDLQELLLYAVKRDWLEGGGSPEHSSFPYLNLIDLGLGARIYVEERSRELDEERQGFVAMWFDKSMDAPYECGIKPGICDAGYKALKINDKPFTGGVVDEIMAEIRKSKFVVADFTTSPQSGVRGNVYFEAGFALGLGKTVFLTCHEDRKDDVHFDIGHLNRIEWETPEDLRKQLKNSIEGVLGHGPHSSSNGDQEIIGSNTSLAAEQSLQQ